MAIGAVMRWDNMDKDMGSAVVAVIEAAKRENNRDYAEKLLEMELEQAGIDKSRLLR